MRWMRPPEDRFLRQTASPEPLSFQVGRPVQVVRVLKKSKGEKWNAKTCNFALLRSDCNWFFLLHHLSRVINCHEFCSVGSARGLSVGRLLKIGLSHWKLTSPSERNALQSVASEHSFACELYLKNRCMHIAGKLFVHAWKIIAIISLFSTCRTRAKREFSPLKRSIRQSYLWPDFHAPEGTLPSIFCRRVSSVTRYADPKRPLVFCLSEVSLPTEQKCAFRWKSRRDQRRSSSSSSSL